MLTTVRDKGFKEGVALIRGILKRLIEIGQIKRWQSGAVSNYREIREHKMVAIFWDKGGEQGARLGVPLITLTMHTNTEDITLLYQTHTTYKQTLTILAHLNIVKEINHECEKFEGCEDNFSHRYILILQ